MKVDFAAVIAGNQPYADAVQGVQPDELPTITGELFDRLDAIAGGATDAEVVVVPRDAALTDPAETAWTLAHVVAHVTAGLEESAALGATLARGVKVTGRSRFEAPWETIRTADQLRQRLAESRRISLAFLGAWPDVPNLALTDTPVPHFGPVDAVGRHLLGVMHGQWHLDQLREIVRQARATSGAAPVPA